MTDRDDHAGRFRAVAGVLRDWARTHPHDYALLYGSPVPGYVAPDDTVTSATRVSFALLRIAADARAAGRTVLARPVSGAELAGLAPVRGFVSPELGTDLGLA